jgi:hypothetical protein
MELRQFTTDELAAIQKRAYDVGDQELFSIVEECLQHRRLRRSGTIEASSGVSAGTGQGFVRITWNEEEGQLDPDVAKSLGQSIIDAGYSAEHDAYFVAFLHNKVGMSRETAAMALGDLRLLREERSQRKPL